MVLLGTEFTESNGYFSRISPAQGQKHITHESFGMIKTGMSLQALSFMKVNAHTWSFLQRIVKEAVGRHHLYQNGAYEIHLTHLMLSFIFIFSLYFVS
jgi:hypothetical protein